MMFLYFATAVYCLSSTVFAATSGCGKAPSSVQAGRNTININSTSREWILTLPSNYNNTYPYRLVFGLHWLSGTYTDVANGNSNLQPYYGLPPLMNDTAIFIAPNGLNKGWANSGGQDITFIREVMKAVEAEYCVNEQLRFSLGFSYGGAMSYSVACSMGKDFRAVAALSGALLSGCDGGTDPVAYYGQHGINDQVLNITMGRQIRDTFVKNNGCTSQLPPEPAKGSKTHVLTKYAGCATDKPVWWTAFDGDHTPVPADGGSNNKNTTFSVPQVWDFFLQFK